MRKIIDTTKAINLLIKKRVRSIVKNYDLFKGGFFYFKHKIKLKNEDLLSILFKGDYFRKGMPHPSVFSFSINLDLKKNKILKQKNIITIDNNIIGLFMKKKFVGKDLISKSFYPIYLKSEITSKYIKKKLENSDVYLSRTGIGFIIETSYAAGNYMLLELPYRLL